MRNLISINDLGREDIEEILESADAIRISPEKFYGDLGGKSLSIAFFEPSLRTRAGFSLAMQKLGGSVVEVTEQKYTGNMNSPESLEDTLRIIADYSDIIALRHPRPEPARNIKLSCSLINCGNGNDEHPTQALIDLYTIWKHFGRIDGLQISIVGDLKNMRAAHSLIMGLKHFSDMKIRLISPSSLKLESRYTDGLPLDHVLEQQEFKIDNDDVIYMAGFPPQKGNMETSVENRRIYQLDAEKAKLLNGNSIIMNPMPIVDEIAREVDGLRNAKYFEQSKNGLYVRMGILKWTLS